MRIIETTPEEKLFKEIYNGFSTELLSSALKQSGSANLIISPYSLLTGLVIVSQSTSGYTRNEIDTVIQCSITGSYLKELQDNIFSGKECSVANAVIVSEHLKNYILPDYREEIQQQFHAKLFSSDIAPAVINSWVRRNTHGKITQVPFDGSSVDAVACILNAIAFESQWLQVYKPSDVKKNPFYNSDQTISYPYCLHSTENFYIEDELFTGFIKPYKGLSYCFMGLLPKDEKKSLVHIATDNRIDFSGLFRKKRQTTVIIEMPEFSNTCDINYTEFLKEQGIQTVFTDYADFSPMAQKPLKLLKVAQKAQINVNRKGTHAEALTRILVGLGCINPPPPPVVKLNRRFPLCNCPLFFRLAVIHRCC